MTLFPRSSTPPPGVVRDDSRSHEAQNISGRLGHRYGGESHHPAIYGSTGEGGGGGRRAHVHCQPEQGAETVVTDTVVRTRSSITVSNNEIREVGVGNRPAEIA